MSWEEIKLCKCELEFELPNLFAEMRNGKLIMSYDAYSIDSSFYEEVKINYCPICGESLKDK